MSWAGPLCINVLKLAVMPVEPPVPEAAQDESTLRAAIAKLHTNLGHPSNEALARAIRLTGGSDAAIALAF